MKFNFFRKRRKEKFEIGCPACRGKMTMSVDRIEGSDDYREIQKTYRCSKCGIELSSLELITRSSALPSLFKSISQLMSSVSNLGASLQTLYPLEPDAKKQHADRAVNTRSMN